VTKDSKVEWVTRLPHSREAYASTAEFVEIIKSRPGVWAVYKRYSGERKWSNRTTYAKNYPGTEWEMRIVRGKTVVYGRWVGSSRKRSK